MRNNIRKIFSLICALAMLLSSIPFPVTAESADPATATDMLPVANREITLPADASQNEWNIDGAISGEDSQYLLRIHSERSASLCFLLTSDQELDAAVVREEDEQTIRFRKNEEAKEYFLTDYAVTPASYLIQIQGQPSAAFSLRILTKAAWEAWQDTLQKEQEMAQRAQESISLTNADFSAVQLSQEETDALLQYLPRPAMKLKTMAKSAAPAAAEYTQQSTGYLAFDISLNNTSMEGYGSYTVPVSLNEKVDMIGDRADSDKKGNLVIKETKVELYHITKDDNGNTNAEPLNVNANIEDGYLSGFTFETTGFSDYILKYTVDFHYEGIDYSIPGESQILLSDLIEKLQILNGDALLNVADVASVQFTDEHLVKIEQVSGLITYNDVQNVNVGEKDFLLTSETSFTSKETLTIWLINGEPIIVGVTDAQYRYVHLKGQDTMTMQQMLGSDFKSDFAFYYADPDTISVSNGTYVLSNLNSIPYATGGSVWIYDWDDNVKDWVYKTILLQDYIYEVTQIEETTLSDMMASLTVPVPSSTVAILSSDSAPGIYVHNGNEFSITSTTFPEEGIAYDLYDPDTHQFLPYGLVIKGSSAASEKNDGIFTYKIVDNTAEITGLVDEEFFDSSADHDNYTIPAEVTLDGTEYQVVAIQRDAFRNEVRIKTLALADSDTTLRLDIESLSGMPYVTSITGDRQVKFNTIGGVVTNDDSLTSLRLNIQGSFTYTETPISGNPKLVNVELTCSSFSTLGSNFLMNYFIGIQ